MCVCDCVFVIVVVVVVVFVVVVCLWLWVCDCVCGLSAHDCLWRCFAGLIKGCGEKGFRPRVILCPKDDGAAKLTLLDLWKSSVEVHQRLPETEKVRKVASSLFVSEGSMIQ